MQYQFSRPSLFALRHRSRSRSRATTSTGCAGRGAGPPRHAGRRALRDIKSTVEAGNPEIQIVFDQERAAQLGLVVRDIADRVVNSVRGEVATRYTLLDKKIDVLVRSVDTRAASIEEVRNLIVNPGSFPGAAARGGGREAGDRAGRDPSHRPGARRGRVRRTSHTATSVRRSTR